MIYLVLYLVGSIIVATIFVIFHEKEEKEHKQEEQAKMQETQKGVVCFERGNRNVAYEMHIVHHMGQLNLHMYSLRAYRTAKDLIDHCDELVWDSQGLDLDLGEERLHLPWGAIEQIWMTSRELDSGEIQEGGVTS